MFRPVDDETLAQIISRIEQEKMKQERLSTLSAVSAADSKQSVGVDSTCGSQPVVMDDPLAVTDFSHQPLESPGL